MSHVPKDWVDNLCNPKYVSTLKATTKKGAVYPPGFEPEAAADTAEKQGSEKRRPESELDGMQVQKAWQIALQPLKSLPMNFFMSYMSGTSLQIIPIMAALMLLSGPIKAIFGIRDAFKPVLGNSRTISTIRLAMVLYIIGQGLLMYIGIRKLNQMGLIPNTKSDWLAWEPHMDYTKKLKSLVV
ncbi:chaperone [Maudiozyma humilis]|uniref:ER membrane protein complex subunit 4 n=1 Tax=Maudiozyma humilis TaxID=51915 RepID=A0AAV5RUC2_MAUHU|nr:chaperone [Kazachstania humilis]